MWRVKPLNHMIKIANEDQVRYLVAIPAWWLSGFCVGKEKRKCELRSWVGFEKLSSALRCSNKPSLKGVVSSTPAAAALPEWVRLQQIITQNPKSSQDKNTKAQESNWNEKKEWTCCLICDSPLFIALHKSKATSFSSFSACPVFDLNLSNWRNKQKTLKIESWNFTGKLWKRENAISSRLLLLIKP